MTLLIVPKDRKETGMIVFLTTNRTSVSQMLWVWYGYVVRNYRGHSRILNMQNDQTNFIACEVTKLPRHTCTVVLRWLCGLEWCLLKLHIGYPNNSHWRNPNRLWLIPGIFPIPDDDRHCPLGRPKTRPSNREQQFSTWWLARFLRYLVNNINDSAAQVGHTTHNESILLVNWLMSIYLGISAIAVKSGQRWHWNDLFEMTCLDWKSGRRSHSGTFLRYIFLYCSYLSTGGCCHQIETIVRQCCLRYQV